MLTVVLLASTAPFRMASAMNSCKGTLLGRRMSGILPYSGQDMVESLESLGIFIDLTQMFEVALYCAHNPLRFVLCNLLLKSFGSHFLSICAD